MHYENKDTFWQKEFEDLFTLREMFLFPCLKREIRSDPFIEFVTMGLSFF